MRSIVLIVHNVRSSHNVGALLRTAEGLGVDKLLLTGYSPYPTAPGDKRLPHLSQKITRDINKTALGAENTLDWQYLEDGLQAIKVMKKAGYSVWAVEQSPDSIKLPSFKVPADCALVVGREVEGIEPEILAACDGILEIPMFGSKESFNVVQAAAMALYHCRFQPSDILG